ncbi:hypothetical protein PR202_gb23462 [Eleusine coracana subsp. coracana]|uniref:SCP domain-containing protein n=1 Tax=Eleusine coracana subsp. coracana TaxID=191504 RepID=A0AAV5FJH2_ELECO|nr:hypothetical protein QOZ80_6BG0478000 [Eleusine coracana subsp. coracana]GJN34767.1 hypothetical protein PR202_gb23462 [Eleusine coracana subsp. coracana]
MARLINFAAAALLVPGSRHPALALNNSTSDFLRPHNAARAEVGVGKLAWDADLAAYAHRYAEKRARDCALVHSREPYGENIYRCSAGRRRAVANAVARWVEERDGYDCRSNRCARKRGCGHYTQVVWAATKHLGCAAVECRNGGTFVVCSYDPPGNIHEEAPYPACGRHRVVAA